jgi:tetratricopeptide (TPR) repeat protein
MRIDAPLARAARIARFSFGGVYALGHEIVALCAVPLLALARWLRRPRRRPSIAPPLFLTIEVEPDLHEGQYPLITAQLQSTAHDEPTPSSKLLDLRARAVTLELFAYLTATWQATSDDVPRLAVLLDYEPWALLRIDVERLLRPLADRGMRVHVFYAQQEQDAARWFADGVVRHSNLRGLIAWLRLEWRRHPPSSWSKILDATSLLMQACAEYEDVSDLIIELVDIAFSFEGAAAADHANRHARAAVRWAGTTPSAARCRALRSLALTQLRLADPRAALLYLDTAVRDAIVIGDRVEEVRALVELAGHSLRSNNLPRAENQLRRAHDLLPPDAPDALRATVHRRLADVRNQQGLNDEETEHHATAALKLDHEGSDLALHDYALIGRVQASRQRRIRRPIAEAADRDNR